MSASWYDVLGVDETATPEEIRTAWKDSIAELSPGDRKFRVCNEAAEVLLDPDRRAAYDAEIGIDRLRPPTCDETPTWPPRPTRGPRHRRARRRRDTARGRGPSSEAREGGALAADRAGPVVHRP